MQKKDCYELGKITKTHGLQGDVVIYLDVDNPLEYQSLDIILLEIQQKLVPYTITKFNLYKTRQAIVSFEEVINIDQAETLRNVKLFLPLDILPRIEEEDNFYLHEVIDYKVVDKNLGELGTVKEFVETGVQVLMTMVFKGHEILVPMNDEIVLSVNREKKELYTILPDGLIDVYLEDEK